MRIPYADVVLERVPPGVSEEQAIFVGDNLITGKWQILPNGQQRRYYHITEKGQQVLAKRLATWQDFSTAVKAVIQAETT
jgi:hypothetical protein